MENNNPADQRGRRYGEELGAQIAAMYNDRLDSMEEYLLQAIRDMYSYTGPVNITGAPAMLIYTVVKKVRRKLIFEMGREDIGPRFRLAYALLTVALGCVACSLLIYVLLGDMPWLILTLYVLTLITLLAFESVD